MLEPTLTAMHELKVPVGIDWELLVVNNNCTDNTDEVIARHEKKLPIRRLFEPEQGLSRARNRAVAEARGDLLLWTDDDVLVDADWLEQYVKAAAEWPEAAFFGGTVDPWFGVDPPGWMLTHLPRLGAPFAIRQLGGDVRRIDKGDDLPFGANMAMRRSALDSISFAPHLGRCGTASLLGEESDVMNRLIDAGRYGVWVGSARVRHYIPSERLTIDYLWDYSGGSGKSRVRPGNFADVPTAFGAPRWVWRDFLATRAKSLLRAPGKNDASMRAFIRAAFAWGIIAEFRAGQTVSQTNATSSATTTTRQST